ncbi:MAG: hypothetical protein VX112_01200 [Pseudomonadota bacterium]|nr:hypothetical protein [Pseudomonadota bacterium]
MQDTKLNVVYDGSLYQALRFYWRSFYSTGGALFLLSALLLTLGVSYAFPQLLMYSNAIFWSRMYGDQVPLIISCALFVIVQHAVFSCFEKLLDFLFEWLALDHAIEVLQSMAQASRLRSPSALFQTGLIFSQSLVDTNAFFDSCSKFIKNTLYACGVIFSSFVFLSRYGFARLGGVVFSFMALTDYLVYRFTRSSGQNSLLGQSNLTDAITMRNSAESQIRTEVDSLIKKQAIWRGVPGLFKARVDYLATSLNHRYDKNVRSVINFERAIETFIELIRRWIQPVITVIAIVFLGLQFPLGVSGQGVSIGVFMQVIAAFTQLWLFGSVVKSNFKYIGSALAGYKSIGSLVSVYGEKSIGMSKVNKPSTWMLLCHQIVLSTWLYNFCAFSFRVAQYFQMTSAIVVLPYHNVLMWGLVSLLLLWLPKKHVDIGVFATSVGLGVAMLFVSLCNSVNGGMSYYAQSTIGLALYVAGVLVASIIGWRYKVGLSQREGRLQVLEKASGAMVVGKHASTSSRSSCIQLQDLALYPTEEEAKQPAIVRFGIGQSVTLTQGQPCVVHGRNGLGKSSLLMRALVEGEGSVPFLTRLQGVISGEVDYRLVFVQAGNPTADIMLYKKSYCLQDKKGAKTSLTDIQKVFFSLLVQNAMALTDQDHLVLSHWPFFEQIILGYLADIRLACNPSIGVDIMQSGTLSEHVKGADAAKLLAAVLYAAMHVAVGSKFGGVSMLVAIDEGFEDVSPDEREYIVEKFCQLASRADARLYYVAVLHNKKLHKFFSESIHLSKYQDHPNLQVNVKQTKC